MTPLKYHIHKNNTVLGIANNRYSNISTKHLYDRSKNVCIGLKHEFSKFQHQITSRDKTMQSSVTFDNSLNPKPMRRASSSRLAFQNIVLSASVGPVNLNSVVLPSDLVW